MHDFYVLGFFPGFSGDFICDLISKTSEFNYISNTPKDSNNRYYFQSDIDPNYRLKMSNNAQDWHLPEDRLNLIKTRLESNQIIIPSHYNGILNSNIPNLKYIKVQGKHSLAPMFYILLWTKVYLKVSDFDPDNFVKTLSKEKLTELYIPGTTKFYNYKRFMMQFGYDNISDYLTSQWSRCLNFLNGNHYNSLAVNLDNLYLDTNRYLNEFKKIFQAVQDSELMAPSTKSVLVVG